ncbi:PQQ-dependent sugar dehydrogenase [Lapillicoccus jejuensis]
MTRTLTTGLNVPWGLARLPDGSVLVSSRDTAQVHRVDVTTGRASLVGTVPGVVSNGRSGGEGGLLGLAVGASYGQDRRVWAYHSTASDNRVVVLTLDASRPAGQQLSAPRVLVDGIPHGLHHNGGRLGFDAAGTLWATTGEAGTPSLAQDRGSLGGKILRMTSQGRPAAGNPFGSLVFSYGHRNVQGLAWDPAGRLWASEFGDKAFDELNLVQRGANYGWPATQGRTSVAGYTSPVAQWGTEEDSPSGIAWAAGCVWMAALKGRRLWRIPLDGTRVVAAPQAFLTGTYGRLRSVLALDDRTLLVTTSNTDGRSTPRSGDDRLLVVSVS